GGRLVLLFLLVELSLQLDQFAGGVVDQGPLLVDLLLLNVERLLALGLLLLHGDRERGLVLGGLGLELGGGAVERSLELLDPGGEGLAVLALGFDLVVEQLFVGAGLSLGVL